MAQGTFGPYLALVLLLGVAGGVSLWDRGHDVGPAPGFAVVTTGAAPGENGTPQSIALADLRGHVVLLDLMAVTCEPCRVVANDVLKPIWEERGDDADFTLLSIDTWADPVAGQGFGGETREDLAELQRSEDLPWPHALDTDEVYRKYSAVQLPKIVVIDPDGRVVYEKTGIPDRDAVEAALDRAAARDATPVPTLRLGLAGLAFVAGLASVLSPCTVGLLPAYLGLLLDDARAGSRRRTVLAGLAAASGIVAAYALLALLFAAAGSTLRPFLPVLRPLIGALLLLLGLAALAGRTWMRLDRLVGAGRPDGRKGFFAFGLAYALAGFGCTGPLFLPILLAGFLRSTGYGALLFVLYAAAVAALVVLAALLVAAGNEATLRRLLGKGIWLHRAAALLMVAAGTWILWGSLRLQAF